jgi:hypothetical protein
LWEEEAVEAEAAWFISAGARAGFSLVSEKSVLSVRFFRRGRRGESEL